MQKRFLLDIPPAPYIIHYRGVTIGELDRALRKSGLVVPTNVVLRSVTYGGVIATGCHGPGWDCQTLSDLVESMTIVLASGEVVTFSEETHGPEMMNAIRLNLGLFGIIHEMTLRGEIPPQPRVGVLLYQK